MNGRSNNQSNRQNNINVAIIGAAAVIIAALIAAFSQCNGSRENSAAKDGQNVKAETINGPVTSHVDSQVNNYYGDASPEKGKISPRPVDTPKNNPEIIPQSDNGPANQSTTPVTAMPDGTFDKPAEKKPAASLLTNKTLRFSALEADPSDKGVVFSCDGTLTINERNEIIGKLDWQVYSVPQTYSSYARRQNESATENVRGYLDPITNKLSFNGYSITGPQDFIIRDRYEFELMSASKELTCRHWGRGPSWDNLYNIKYAIAD